MNAKITLLNTLFIFMVLSFSFAFAQEGMIHGKVTDGNGKGIEGVKVQLLNTDHHTETDKKGNYALMEVEFGSYTMELYHRDFDVDFVPFQIEENQITFNRMMQKNVSIYDNIEVFGEREKQPEKLDVITRLPLKPYEQIQSITVISEKLIEQQGALSISETSRNVPGVYTYATFGGVQESMASRGFRGIPVVKNGIRIQTDFRGPGFATDFSGVESLQVLKGASSVTMGVATDLGSAGGIINIVTKTPQFKNTGKVGLRLGSFNQFRPTFDVQNTLGNNNQFAFRINGAYERNRTFKNIKGLGQEKFYINPSLAWRPDGKTSIVLEMDYLNNLNAFDPGTVNTSVDNTTNEIYDLGDRFLGFIGNNSLQKTMTMTGTLKRDISKNLYIRAGYYYASYNADQIVSSLAPLSQDDGYNLERNLLYQRALGRSNDRIDKSHVVQLDLVGNKIKHGIFKHTFQAGIDFRTTYYETKTYDSYVIDTVDITQNVNNTLTNFDDPFNLTGTTDATSREFGLNLQEVLEITDYVRLFGGVRFGTYLSYTSDFTTNTAETFWNPVGGIMVKVWEGINVFGSYTNSTNPRSAARLDIDGNPLGNERIDQIEAGIKTTWFNDRLRFNATYYKINNKDMNIQAAVLNESTGMVELQDYYIKGGNDQRQGVELELTGRPIENLDVIIGYSYIDAKYLEHTTFVPGSSPNNTPNHTFNAYVNYHFTKTAVKGLSIGAGFYYIGDRYYNDWTQENVQFHGIQPNLEPWKNKAYSIMNVQIGYDFRYMENAVLQQFGVQFFANNLLNTEGYDAYRTRFINRIQPQSFGLQINYRF